MSVLPDGRIAVVGQQDVLVFTSDGSTSWRSALPCTPSAVAASPSNVVVVACDTGDLLRFGTTGAPVASWVIPGNLGLRHAVSMVFEPAGSLFVHAARMSERLVESRVVTRLDPTGAPVFTITEPLPGGDTPALSPRNPGIRLTSDGLGFAYLPHRVVVNGPVLRASDAGAVLQAFTPAGTALWAVDKPHIGASVIDPAWDSVVVFDTACDRAGHCALFGSYEGGWIEVFSTASR